MITFSSHFSPLFRPIEGRSVGEPDHSSPVRVHESYSLGRGHRPTENAPAPPRSQAAAARRIFTAKRVLCSRMSCPKQESKRPSRRSTGYPVSPVTPTAARRSSAVRLPPTDRSLWLECQQYRQGYPDRRTALERTSGGVCQPVKGQARVLTAVAVLAAVACAALAVLAVGFLRSGAYSRMLGNCQVKPGSARPNHRSAASRARRRASAHATAGPPS